MESLRYTDGNISGNACLRFFCGCAKVRGESDIGQTEERVFFRLQRFVRPYVNTGSGDFSILQCLGERFDIDDCTAGCIDDADAVFHLCNGFFINHTACLICKRCVEGDVVRFTEKCIQIGQFHAELLASFQRDIRIIADGLHVESLQTFSHIGTYAADADDAHGLVQKLDACEALSVPAAFHDGLVCLRNVARHGEHQSNCVLAGCNRIGFRRIDDSDAFLGSFGNIDAVDTDTGSADNLQVHSRINDLLGDACLASCNDGIIVSNDFAELIFFHIRLDIYNKFLFKDFLGFFGNVGGDENSVHDDSSLGVMVSGMMINRWFFCILS